ncbi:MAG: tetratricopeptide repeat protein [Gammaproteobacteria bacterium]|nr:tetratricopeptide repeat protein [Gammaproteobacteria bacterium]
MVKLAHKLILMVTVASMLVACGSFGGKRGSTIGGLNKKRVKVKVDVPVVSSRTKAISQYKKLVNEDPNNVHPEVLRRLGDLRMEETEDQMAENVQAPDKNSYKETIKLYEDVLANHSAYPNRDRVLYQLSRAYELTGQHEKALKALDQLVYEYPESNYFGETQFRRAEILFVEKQYAQAEDAYEAVIKQGTEGRFYIHSLYKHGWSHFKQVDYDYGIPSFNTVLDNLLVAGVEEENIAQLSQPDQELLDDTLRAISLSFAYLGGPEEVSKFYTESERQPYEILVYERLGKQYLDKRRWSDAANTYRQYVETHQFSPKAPHFQIKSMEAYKKGEFPSEVLRAKKQFVVDYNLKSEYWQHNDVAQSDDIVTFLKSNITDLAKHYHSIAQKERKKPKEYYNEAATWYNAYLESFPQDEKASEMNFHLAEVHYETKQYANAVREYEKTAYGYKKHPKSAESGYAAIIAYNEWLKQDQQAAQQSVIKNQLIDSSFKFTENFPEHPEVAKVMTVTAEELYARKDYARATKASDIIISDHSNADKKLVLSAWTVKANSAFDTGQYGASEKAYIEALGKVDANEELRDPLKDRLAASVYKQGEASKKAGDLDAAVSHYLRVGQVVPDAEIRATAQYDASAALLELEDWNRASSTLEDFRQRYPSHELQGDVTQKLAVSYDKGGQHLKAAKEYEAIGTSSSDPALKREARFHAAELYGKGGDFYGAEKSLIAYVKDHPKPTEPAMEAMQKLVDMYTERKYIDDKLNWQRKIIDADARAGSERSDRTKFLAANATLDLAKPEYDAFSQIFLLHPLKKNLKLKKRQMQVALDAYEAASNYKVQQVTTAATYWSAKIYQEFAIAMMESDRPSGLSVEEFDQYEILLEEQAYPFEEQAIELHELNASRISDDIYDEWVKKSLAELAVLSPAQYVKAERSEDLVQNIY